MIDFHADVATALLSEILTNNASGAIMYPIAAIAGDKLKIEVRAGAFDGFTEALFQYINASSFPSKTLSFPLHCLSQQPIAMSVAIMLGASAGFINPFSYQTNMMVYSAGNYRCGWVLLRPEDDNTLLFCSQHVHTYTATRAVMLISPLYWKTGLWSSWSSESPSKRICS